MGYQEAHLCYLICRFFARQAYDKANRVVFEKNVTDVYGMPQPTFEYTPTEKYADEAGRMMKEYVLNVGRGVDDR